MVPVDGMHFWAFKVIRGPVSHTAACVCGLGGNSLLITCSQYQMALGVVLNTLLGGRCGRSSFDEPGEL